MDMDDEQKTHINTIMKNPEIKQLQENVRTAKKLNNFFGCYVTCWIFMNITIILLIISFNVVNEEIQHQKDKNHRYQTFNGFIISHNFHYDMVDDNYHLDMIGENVNGFNCTYLDYLISSKNVMNAIIVRDTGMKVKWSFDTETGFCRDYHAENTIRTLDVFAFMASVVLLLYAFVVTVSLINCVIGRGANEMPNNDIGNIGLIVQFHGEWLIVNIIFSPLLSCEVELSQYKIYWNARSIVCVLFIGVFSLWNLVVMWYLSSTVPVRAIDKYNKWLDSHGLREDECTGKITLKCVVPKSVIVPVPVPMYVEEENGLTKTIGKINNVVGHIFNSNANVTDYQRVPMSMNTIDGTENETEMKIYLKC